jgi:hypothetical protein
MSPLYTHMHTGSQPVLQDMHIEKGSFLSNSYSDLILPDNNLVIRVAIIKRKYMSLEFRLATLILSSF